MSYMSHLRDAIIFAKRQTSLDTDIEDAYVCIMTEGPFDARHMAMLRSFMAKKQFELDDFERYNAPGERTEARKQATRLRRD